MAKSMSKSSPFPYKRILQQCEGIGFAFCVMACAIESLPASQQIGATKTDDIAALLRTASALHNQSDYSQSIPTLKRIVRLSPRNYQANLLLVVDLLCSGKPR